MDNISQQSDEMEALTSIFGDEWQMDPGTKMCSIDITKEVKLFITLIPEYPSSSLPQYELLAPNLSLQQKKHIDEEFENLYKNEGGGPIIYQMIMIVEEIAKTKNVTETSSPEELLQCDKECQRLVTPIEKSHLNIIHGAIIVDRKSVFQGHVCTVNSKDDVSSFKELLLENRKVAHATHNISAYRINLPNNIVLQDCDDDGEAKASARLLELLQTLKLNNIIVVVSRWYGGVQLGPDRFRHINNAARQALVDGGYIPRFPQFCILDQILCIIKGHYWPTRCRYGAHCLVWQEIVHLQTLPVAKKGDWGSTSIENVRVLRKHLCKCFNCW
ncbi:unnamed protein product, partial [Phaedon cochleariae]